MSYLRTAFAVVLLASGSTMFGQSSEVSIQTPPPPKYLGRLLKPFHPERRVVAAAKLSNSPRLESLVRGGNLYLSVQDVIALALENNLDIAVQRYSPFLASEVLRRAEGVRKLLPLLNRLYRDTADSHRNARTSSCRTWPCPSIIWATG